MHAHTHTHTNTCTHTHTHMRTHTHTHTLKHAHPHTHTHTQTHRESDTHKHTNTPHTGGLVFNVPSARRAPLEMRVGGGPVGGKPGPISTNPGLDSRGRPQGSPISCPHVCVCVCVCILSVCVCACPGLSVSVSVCVVITNYELGSGCITYLLYRSLNSIFWLFSHHCRSCRSCSVLLALSPFWADPRIITCHATSSSPTLLLQTTRFDMGHPIHMVCRTCDSP